MSMFKAHDVNYRSASRDFFFFFFLTILLFHQMLQGLPFMMMKMMMIFVRFKKEGGASLVREVFWRSGLI